jgi:hypothetical protein
MRDLDNMAQMFEQMATALEQTVRLLEAADREAVAFFDGDGTGAEGRLVTSLPHKDAWDEIEGFFKKIADDGKRLIEDTKKEMEKLIEYVRGEGVEQVDALVLEEINKQLPPDGIGEEFAGYKTDAKLKIPGALVGAPGVDVYVEGGADVRLTRDESGNIIVTIEGMAGAGVEGSVGIATLGGGGRGRGEFNFKFDPREKGDMSALLALLATTGGVGLLASGGLGSAAGGGVLAVTGTSMTIAGEQVNFLDEFESCHFEGGGYGEGEFKLGKNKAKVSREVMLGGGIERGDDGQLRPTNSFRYNLEAEGNLESGDVSGGVAVDVQAVSKHNPPGTEVSLSLEGKAGFDFDTDDVKDTLGEMGIDSVDFEVTAAGKTEVKLETSKSIVEIAECYDLSTGKMDFSSLKGNTEMTISTVHTLDSSLEAELSADSLDVGVSGSGGSYVGRKVSTKVPL